jgi:DNA-binding response OmpR family regulator
MKDKVILVVDDEEIALIILQNALEMEGYTVITAQDGLVAAELFNLSQPDAVVLDMLLPGKDGIDLIPEFKKVAPETFIIAISATEHYLYVSKMLGANVIISKDNSPDAVIESLENMFNKLVVL